MDNISDFFHDIKDRATNPLIASFVIAWCLWNWKIPAGIVFLKPEILAKQGYGSMLDFIQHEINNTCRTIVFPLISAITYTCVMPLAKWGISALNTHFKTKSNNTNLKIVGTGIVPGSLFLKIRDEYEKEKITVSELITNEGKTAAENIALNNQVKELQSALELAGEHARDESAKNDSLLSKFDVKTLDGVWIYEYKSPSGLSAADRWRFLDGQIIRIIENSNNTIQKNIGDILEYYINVKTHGIVLIIKYIEGNVSTQFLRYDDSFRKLEGESNDGFLIKYVSQ